jgi:hypothetical protein
MENESLEGFNQTCRDFYSDLLPVTAFHAASFTECRVKELQMASSGFLQHP